MHRLSESQRKKRQRRRWVTKPVRSYWKVLLRKTDHDQFMHDIRSAGL